MKYAQTLLTLQSCVVRALNVHGISVSVGLSTSHCSVGATPLSTHASTADEQQVPHLTGLSWSGMQVMEFRYKRNQLYTLNAAVGAAAGAASVLSLSLSLLLSQSAWASTTAADTWAGF